MHSYKLQKVRPKTACLHLVPSSSTFHNSEYYEYIFKYKYLFLTANIWSNLVFFQFSISDRTTIFCSYAFGTLFRNKKAADKFWANCQQILQISCQICRIFRNFFYSNDIIKFRMFRQICREIHQICRDIRKKVL